MKSKCYIYTSTKEARLIVVGTGIPDSLVSLRSCCDPAELSGLGKLNCVRLPVNDKRELKIKVIKLTDIDKELVL